MNGSSLSDRRFSDMVAERRGCGSDELLVSAVIVALNAQEYIATCLESVDRLADEIILCDAGSTDRTVFIASEYGVDIFQEPRTGDAAYHRNRGLAKAAGRYRLVMNAREEIVYTDVDETRFRLANDDLRSVLSVRLVRVYPDGRQETVVIPRLIRRGSKWNFGLAAKARSDSDAPGIDASNLTLLDHASAPAQGTPDFEETEEPALCRVENDWDFRDWMTLRGSDCDDERMMSVEEWVDLEFPARLT